MANVKAAKADRDEFATLDASALQVKLDESRKKLWQDRFALGKRSLENTAQLSKTRKRIARIHTYLRQLELKEGK